ncbi:unnamed protein product [Psylliodes chrysocephalus]|uniref:Uncharacterized protein n=1 Tax=Psylliodes chrysocephalus TaxID=3402493 RepID=A0A9P0D112_9CUCU|nr:unnamed protein product [Psylliodes chrysocephala]
MQVISQEQNNNAKGEDNCSNGQSNGSIIYQKPRRNRISGLTGPRVTYMEVDSQDEDQYNNTVYPRSMQRHCGQPFPQRISSGLAPFLYNKKTNFSIVGNSSDRFVRHDEVESSSSLCVKRSQRPQSPFYQCIQQELDVPSSLAVSPSVSDSSSVKPSQLSQGNQHSDSTEVGARFLEDLKSRIIAGPLKIQNLSLHLVDMNTGNPLPRAEELRLEAWKIQGGPVL